MCAKSRYDDVVKPKLEQIKAYVAEGKTRAQVCKDLLGGQITDKSLRRYAAQHQELRDALDEGTKTAADRMTQSLFRAGEGYYYEETKCTYDEDGKLIERIVYRRYAKPDVRAQQLWLINRDRKNWTSDGRQQITDDAATGGVIEIPAIDAAGFEAERQAEMARLEAADDTA